LTESLSKKCSVFLPDRIFLSTFRGDEKARFPFDRFVRCIARCPENWYNFETYGLFIVFLSFSRIWHRPLFADNVKQRKTNYLERKTSFFFFLQNNLIGVITYCNSKSGLCRYITKRESRARYFNCYKLNIKLSIKLLNIT